MNEKIIEIIKKNCALDDEITLDSELKLLSLDSLTFVTILVEIEELYNIEFDIEKLDIKSWNTVIDLIKEVEKMCNEKV